MGFFNRRRRGRTLLLAAVLWFGCGDGANPGGGGGGLSETVPLGGLKWMTKNLNVPTEDSWCYDGITANCNKYGRLYTWEAAKRACRSVGMRLPSNHEWEKLVAAATGDYSAGYNLKSKSGWYNNGNGSDKFGFSALPGGRRYSDGNFDIAGSSGNWWTATEYSDGHAYIRGMNYLDDYVGESYFYKSYGFSARCVQD